MPNPFISPDETIIRTKIPVFAPRHIESVAAYTEWIPEAGDKAFAASQDFAFTIGEDSSSGSTYIDWPASLPLGIAPGITFTFNVAVDLVVM
jgi:hypothetical protein